MVHSHTHTLLCWDGMGWDGCNGSSSVFRVSNTPGNPGNLLELFFLLEIYKVSWKLCGSVRNAMAVSVQCIDIQLALLIISYFER